LPEYDEERVYPSGLFLHKSGYLIAAQDAWGNVRFAEFDKCHKVIKTTELQLPLYSSTSSTSCQFFQLKHSKAYIVSGVIEGKGAFLLKLDADLKVVWSKTYGMHQSASFYNVIEAKNGDIIAIGLTNELSGDFLFARIAGTDGTVKWMNSHKDLLWPQLIEGDNGNLYFASMDKNRNTEFFIFSTDASGKVIWSETSNSKMGAVALKQFSNGNLYLTGNLHQSGKISGFGVMKFYKNGNLDWHKQYRDNASGPTGSATIDELPNNNIAISGIQGDSYPYKGFINVLDSGGNFSFAKTYSMPIYTNVFIAKPTQENEFLMLTEGENNKEIRLIKTDNKGEVDCIGEDLALSVIKINNDLVTRNFKPTALVVSAADFNVKYSDFKIKESVICTNQVPFADLGPDTSFCFNQIYTIDVGPRNPGCSFLWSTGDTTSALTFTKTDKYWVQITKNFCTHSDTVFLEFPTHKLVKLDSSLTVCSYEKPAIDAGNYATKYEWTLPGKTKTFSSLIVALDSGLYILKATSKNGCVEYDSIQVNYHPMPKANAGPDTAICYGSSVYLQGSGGFSYLWTPAYYLDDSTVSNPKANPTNTQRYFLITTGEKGCTDTSTVLLKVKPKLQATLVTKNIIICKGEIANVSVKSKEGGTGNYAFSWYNKDSTLTFTGEKISFVPEASMWLYMRMQDGCSKHFSDSVYIEVLPVPDVDFNSSVTQGCQPLAVKFSLEEKYDPQNKYTWNFGDGTSDSTYNPTHIYTNTGKWFATVTVKNKNGCVKISTVAQEIIVHPVPIAFYEPIPIITDIEHPEVSFKNTSSGADKYNWSFGDGKTSVEINPKNTYTDTGNYIVQLVAENNFGCTDTFQSIFQVKDIYRFHVPNAFTPNADDINSYFFPVTTYTKSYNMQIYNRWGAKIFYSEDGSPRWDGRFKGSLVQDDIYMYLITVLDKDNRKHYYNGLIHLLK
ncbi:MAG: PKD domain-containing protein, partial [Sphingobacteriales bacterium]